jgi:hypothetical protein
VSQPIVAVVNHSTVVSDTEVAGTADAVESDEFAYTVAGVLVSDFVYPAWFVAGSTGPWDHGGHCTAPLQLLQGRGLPQPRGVPAWAGSTLPA